MSAYGNATDAREFWTERGYTIPVGWTDGAIDAARLVVSEWLDARYAGGWPGYKTAERSQVREWPRSGAYDINGWAFNNDEFPRELLSATYLATFYQMSLPGTLAVAYTPPKYKRASVDGAVSAEYVIYNYANEIQTQYPLIDQAIAPLMSRPAGSLSMLSGRTARV